MHPDGPGGLLEFHSVPPADKSTQVDVGLNSKFSFSHPAEVEEISSRWLRETGLAAQIFPDTKCWVWVR